MAPVVGKVQYIVWKTLYPTLLLLSCHLLQCSSEPTVKLRFYDFSVFHLNVKEYVFTLGYNSSVTIGCDIEDISTDTEGSIVLSTGGKILRNSSLMNSRSLVWSGILSGSWSSDLNCHVELNKGNLQAKVSLSGLKLSYGIQAKSCLPNSEDGPYLQNEIVAIFCFSNNNAQWFSDNGILLSSPMVTGRLHHSNATRFVRNYVKLIDQSPMTMTCRGRSSFDTSYCDINTKNIKKEMTLTINITFNNSGVNQSSQMVSFSCETNVPTEYIKWQAETRESHDILDFGKLKDTNKLRFSIRHSKISSHLSFPDEVTALISVSCSTGRAGYIAVATWRNASYAYTSSDQGVPTPTSRELYTSSDQEVSTLTSRELYTSSDQGVFTPTSRELFTSSDQGVSTFTITELYTSSDQEVSTPTSRELYTSSDQEVSTPTSRELYTSSDQGVSTPTSSELYTSSDQGVPTLTVTELYTSSDQEVSTPTSKELFTSSDQGVSTPTSRELYTNSDQGVSTPTSRELYTASDQGVYTPTSRELLPPCSDNSQFFLYTYFIVIIVILCFLSLTSSFCLACVIMKKRNA